MKLKFSKKYFIQCFFLFSNLFNCKKLNDLVTVECFFYASFEINLKKKTYYFVIMSKYENENKSNE